MKITEMLTRQAIKKGIIEQEQEEVFYYCIEKRIASLLIGIPCFLLAVAVSDLWGAVGFYVSFFLIRKYSNGYHASSVWMCLLSSLISELVFLGVIYPLLNAVWAFVIMILSLLAIIILAPYNHPDFNYSSAELISCKKHVLIWLSVLLATTLAAMLLRITALSAGISLGCALAGSSICFAYIFNWRKSYGNNENKTQRNA